MVDINQVCDYIIFRLKVEGEGQLSHLKLQKLLYYVQAWSLAFGKGAFFDGKFQAWVHGPVNRTVYNRFKDSKYMYSSINTSDMFEQDIVNKLSVEAKKHIDSVLEVYAGYSDTELEGKTHSERPWIEARNDFEPFERCEVELDEEIMKVYYKARLK
ncbi:Panacea domain-containing protein [Mucilaginibacter lappiensis]|uniref:Putative phage-associated protein n=1 Tax=Mucilaginibacter lappiensis TaxID=354630 RepID=A0A841JI39_9SPHI|nr:type II toxin-antitoxin system antitoxin SocA domain-containing protein [Mucilaginibacter lappiensis]MBB6128338.1 putative phage-associated protein [Mucilaginibacter lappiensis]